MNRKEPDVVFDGSDIEFKSDLMEIAAHHYKKGRLSRRGFLTALGALGLLPVIGGKARAAVNEIVVVNWGGKASEVLQEVLGDTYEAETGIKVVIDGSGPSAGKIRAMVESGAVVWDVCDSGAGSSIILAKAGITEPIDYDIVDKSKVLPEAIYSHGVGNYTYSYVLATNLKLLGGNVPRTWEDVWNVKDFPGIRTFRKSVRGMLESATMARSIAAKDVYKELSTKEGIAASIDKFKQLRENIIVWGSGSESQNLFLQEEVVIGNIWNTRAYVLRQDMPKGSFDVTFEGGVISPGIWVVPKGNPAGPHAAMEFIKHGQNPELQVRWLELFGPGPINPEAAPLVPGDLKRWNPSDPANLVKQIFYNDTWYSENQVSAEELYVDALIN